MDRNASHADAASADRADRLRQSADGAAQLVRTLYFGFLALGAYIGVTIASTTDLQLLKIAPVRLPLLNVDIPIVGFYLAAPWLVLLAHFNLLLQYHLLARKLHAFTAALQPLNPAARAEQRERLFPLALSQMLVGDHHRGLVRALLWIMVWVSVIMLPLTILIWADLRFRPYQSPGLTWAQRAAVVADIALILVFWPRIVAADGRLAHWWSWVKGPHTTDRFQRSGCRLVLVSLAAVPGFYALLIADLVDVGLAPRYLVLNERILVDGEPSADVLVALSGPDSNEREAAVKRVLGIDLELRRLQGMSFRNGIAPKANLVGADLTGAKLSGARLHYAKLTSAILVGANLSNASLIAADLADTDFTDANLKGADLHAAALEKACGLNVTMPDGEKRNLGKC